MTDKRMAMEKVIEYKDTHSFRQEDLERLFLSVDWSSGHYPDKPVNSIVGL